MPAPGAGAEAWRKLAIKAAPRGAGVLRAQLCVNFVQLQNKEKRT